MFAFIPILAQEANGFDLGSILTYILIGLVVGAVARLLVPDTGGMGILVTIVIGIVGAVIGGWVAGAIFPDTTGVDWIASILVAVILVWIFAASRRNTTVT